MSELVFILTKEFVTICSIGFFARVCQSAVTLLSGTRSDASGAMAADVDKTVAFLAKFSDELVSMQKQTLESLLKSNRSNQVKEWKAAKNFWARKAKTLTAEQREFLEDWEVVLCEMSTLLPVALLPRLQRCLDRCEVFVNQNSETIKHLHGKTLQAVLRGKDLKENCMAVFTSVFCSDIGGCLLKSRRT